MLNILLEHGKEVHISEDLLKIIVANKSGGTQMLADVLKHCKGIPISSALLVEAGIHGGSYGDGRRLLDLIFRYDQNIEITEDAVTAMAKNEIGGAVMLSTLLDHKNTIEFSEDTLVAAAGNESTGAKIFSVILSRSVDIAFNEKTLKAAASNYGSLGQREELFWTIISHNKNIVISTEVMAAMTKKGFDTEEHGVGLDMSIMNSLMDHGSCENKAHGSLKSVEKMMSSHSGRRWHYKDCKIKISPKMKEAAIRWEPDAIDFLNAHKRPNVNFTKSTTQATSEDPDP